MNVAVPLLLVVLATLAPLDGMGQEAGPQRPFSEASTRRPRALNAQESARVAATITGYWAVTPEGPGIVADQNAR